MVLPGNIAVRAGKELCRDGENMRITNDKDANNYLKRVLSFRLVSAAPLADAAAAKTNGAYTEIISIGPFVVVVIVEIIVLSL